MPEEIIAVPIIAIMAWAAVSIVKLLVGRNSVRPAELEKINDRLTRIEQAVDTVAIEIERVSEGQRFATKLLSERGSATPPGSSGPGRYPASS